MPDALWRKIVYELCLQKARAAQAKHPAAPPWTASDIWNMTPDYKWERLYKTLTSFWS